MVAASSVEMVVSLVLLALAAPVAMTHGRTLDILFIGNSHTSVNDVPGSVKHLIERAGPITSVKTTYLSAGHLEDAARDASVLKQVADPKWDAVVLQGAMVSSSHKYTYSQEGVVKLAKTAQKAGAKVFLYAEWPRKGWDETEYTIDVYRSIAKAAPGAKTIAVGRVWDAFLKRHPNASLWMQDGNHAAPLGSYIAACCVAASIDPNLGDPDWSPSGVSKEEAAEVRRLARQLAAPRG